MKCPRCQNEPAGADKNKTEADSLFYITVPPHSACEIRWASGEDSEELDSKILCGGPLRIAVIAD